MRLPGELRNTIYELALGTPRDRVSIKYIRTRPPTAYLLSRVERQEMKAWREPKLFLLSKAIRDEASSIYFGHNTILFRITSADMQRVYDFVKSKTVGPAVTMKWSIQLTRGKWKDMASWISLAKLVDENDLGLTYDTIHQERCLSAGRKWLGACIDQALMEVADIGRKARERGLGYECVVQDFADWVIGKLVWSYQAGISHADKRIVAADLERRTGRVVSRGWTHRL